MKKLAISGLSEQERQRLIKEVTKTDIKAEDQVIIVEALNFIEDILKNANVSLAKIKALLGLEDKKTEKN